MCYVQIVAAYSQILNRYIRMSVCFQIDQGQRFIGFFHRTCVVEIRYIVVETVQFLSNQYVLALGEMLVLRNGFLRFLQKILK